MYQLSANNQYRSSTAKTLKCPLLKYFIESLHTAPQMVTIAMLT